MGYKVLTQFINLAQITSNLKSIENAILVLSYKSRSELNACNESLLSVANCSRKFSTLENFTNDNKGPHTL